jgi:hypothetical protein
MEGFLLGLANNFACLGVCLPVILPYLLTGTTKPAYPIALFMAGRLLSYLIFGLFAGLAGIYLFQRLDPRVFPALLIVLSLWLILFSVGKLTETRGSCGWISKWFKGRFYPFYAGALVGINICPPFMLGFARAIEMQSILRPMIFFLGFFFGSSLWLIPFLFTGKLTGSNSVRMIGRLASFLAGVWYLGLGIISLLKY